MSEQRFNIEDVWPPKENLYPSPPPTASMPKEIPEEGLTKAELTGMRCNPAYTGAVYSFPRLIDRERWISAAARCIKDEGPHQFLVNLLAMLDHTKTRQLLRGLGTTPEFERAINQAEKNDQEKGQR